jgi:hypothetical protein
VCVCKRESVCVCLGKRVCVCARERVFVYVWERESVCVCLRGKNSDIPESGLTVDHKYLRIQHWHEL